MEFFDNRKRVSLLVVLFAGLVLALGSYSVGGALEPISAADITAATQADRFDVDLASTQPVRTGPTGTALAGTKLAGEKVAGEKVASEMSASEKVASEKSASDKSASERVSDTEPAEVMTALPTRIDLTTGLASTILTEGVKAEEMAHYLVSGERGQELSVTLNAIPSVAYFSIYGVEDRQVYTPLGPDSIEWSGILPSDQDYLISVATKDEGADFVLFLELIDLSPFAKLEPGQIYISSGETAGVVSGLIDTERPHRYILHADAGQIINLALKSDDNRADFGIQGAADDRTYKWLYDGAHAWSFVAPTSQEYIFTVAAPISSSASGSDEETNYALTVTLP